MGFYPYFDSTYILILIGVVISLAASARVKSAFGRYSSVRSMSGLTGAQAANRLLQESGILDVRIERIPGNLTDHYDPRNKVLSLSEAVYGQNSLAAIGVAAHECGHAMQHQDAYLPLKLRGSLVPVANFGSMAAIPLILLGWFMGGSELLIDIGIILFSAAVLFQLVTLPVEFNASNRAVRRLSETGILSGEELYQSKKVLDAAAAYLCCRRRCIDASAASACIIIWRGKKT